MYITPETRLLRDMEWNDEALLEGVFWVPPHPEILVNPGIRSVPPYSTKKKHEKPGTFFHKPMPIKDAYEFATTVSSKFASVAPRRLRSMLICSACPVFVCKRLVHNYKYEDQGDAVLGHGYEDGNFFNIKPTEVTKHDPTPALSFIALVRITDMVPSEIVLENEFIPVRTMLRDRAIESKPTDSCARCAVSFQDWAYDPDAAATERCIKEARFMLTRLDAWMAKYKEKELLLSMPRDASFESEVRTKKALVQSSLRSPTKPPVPQSSPAPTAAAAASSPNIVILPTPSPPSA